MAGMKLVCMLLSGLLPYSMLLEGILLVVVLWIDMFLVYLLLNFIFILVSIVLVSMSIGRFCYLHMGGWYVAK